MPVFPPSKWISSKTSSIGIILDADGLKLFEKLNILFETITIPADKHIELIK